MNDTRGLWRGKRIESGEWVFGGLLQIPRLGKNGEIDGTNPAIMERTPEARCYYVDTQTHGKCVGFRDKNRILMFEGDVIIYKSIAGKMWVAKIIYSVNKCRFVQQTSSGQTFEIARRYANCYEVIGNIHDNPELIYKG